MVIVPLYDQDPLERDVVPYVTYALIAANVIVFVLGSLALAPGAFDSFQEAFGFQPSHLFENPFGGAVSPAVTLVSYMFLHAGWLHLIGNMLFLWVFGDNIEDAMGHARFLVFYLLCGIAAALIFAVANSQTNSLLLGASGAIAGVVAAYLMLRPCARIEVLFFVIPVAIDAYLALGAWIAMQVWHVLIGAQDGTAWWAHVGGLMAGALLVVFMRRPGVELFQCVHPLDIIKRRARRMKRVSGLVDLFRANVILD
jgi:membrane associated rhomboid family serine protease